MRGICKLSCIPVRREASSTSEITTMLLWGDMYYVLTEQENWVQIKNDFDQYEGWISKRQFFELTIEPESQSISTGFPFNKATNGKEVFYILPGSVLTDFKDGKFSINNESFELDLPNVGYKKTDVIYVAKQFMNAPYLWGGRSPFGLDCSGFAQNVFRMCGIDLPRDAWQQAEVGKTLDFREEVKTNDLAFFDNADGRIVHVGIMLNPDEIIHASGRVRIDKIDNYGIYDAERDEYSHKLRIIKRV